nr:zinc finger, CCHC-type [Tanacetum cinerariifolium]
MRDFHSCRQEEGQSVSSYVLKMKGYIDNLERLGHPMTLGLGVILILIGLRKEYDGFVQNYNMHSMGNTVNELHAMLKLHEQTLPQSNAHALNAIRAGKVQKGNKHKKSQSQTTARGQNHGNGKNKQAYAPKSKISPPPKRENPAKDSICHEKRTQLLELVIQGLRASRKLKPGALSLYVGNGQREAVEAIGAFYLCLPSGLEIVLNNCHYAPNNVVYFSVVLSDGIFEIDLSNSLTNESSIYAVSNKRANLHLDYALLWHCRLGHISKKRIKKLQHDGLLDSSDLRAFEKCVSCMSGYPKETMGYSFYYPPENKVLIAQNAEFLNDSLINQEASGSLEEDTHPSLDNSLNHEEGDLEIDESQSDIVPIRRSTRTRHALDRMCLYIDAKEHELGDLGEPANYKAALLDTESEKWLNAMNVEMQSMKDNEVWFLVELPPNGTTVGIFTTLIFKKEFVPPLDMHYDTIGPSLKLIG